MDEKNNESVQINCSMCASFSLVVYIYQYSHNAAIFWKQV